MKKIQISSARKSCTNKLTFGMLTNIIPNKFIILGVILFLSLFNQQLFAQVGISESSITPDATAILELRYSSGTYKGFLAPRMTTANRTGIVTPATGLLVYDTNLKSFFYYDGGWIAIPGGSSILGIANGGTAASSFTTYMPLCGGTTTTGAVQSVATGTQYYPLCYNTSTSLPSFQLLPVAGGGTGQSSALSQGGVIYGSSTTAMGSTAAGTVAGQVLQSNATSAPTFSTATYPATASTSGNVLMSNGTNFLSTATGGILVGVRILNAAGTYTPSTDVTRIFIRMVGGGGAGGGVSNTRSGAGGGGGAGAYTERLIAVTNTAYNYTLGAGGTGAATAAGGNGTATSITIGATTITAPFGYGGAYTAGSTTNKFAAGGAGGLAGANGDVIVAGEPGQAGMTFSSGTLASSGNGGSSPFGGGGKGQVGVSVAGIAGTGYGSGGGGACAASNTANAGGAGRPGVIIIWEYK
jgi:hypothetical protein